MNENVMQGVLMRYALDEKRHELAIPNMTTLYNWESDLLSVTRSDLVHEYEIKLSLSDYRRDFDKKWKHISLNHTAYRRPNYFWYVTYQVEIDPPDYAGWMIVEDHGLRVVVKRDAPRLHTDKIRPGDKENIGRLLAYRLKNVYRSFYIEDWYNRENHAPDNQR